MTAKRPIAPLIAPFLLGAALTLGGCVIQAGDTYAAAPTPRAAPVQAAAPAKAKNVILFIGDGMGIFTGIARSTGVTIVPNP